MQKVFYKICTHDLTSKIHITTTGVCPYLEMFACSVCPPEKAKNHCNMLCLGQENSTKFGRGSFGRRPPDDKPPRGGGGRRGGGSGDSKKTSKRARNHQQLRSQTGQNTNGRNGQLPHVRYYTITSPQNINEVLLKIYGE